ncbi:ComEC/Rec2 family competence protein [Halobacteriovorax sp. GB3]|uniref:ComEC/Rec2 family competence protein n=1 Tax=Halobacteriovorax sp. GB3 TaxID=2719615 RepID=UPI00235FA7DE|nr:ComEC/Rec2 family competence protein [Halobacteriovorax sp. GB3]MDD0854410.1 ComEC/Rec2 family competence protein [Halobacteriovorax sp. GB3]
MSKSFLNAILLGDKKSFPRALKKKFQNLGLLHLLTPSGLHLSSLILFLSFILRKFTKSHRIKNTVIGLCLSSVFFFPKLYSLKRMGIFYLLSKSLGSKFQNLDLWYSFLATMLIDLLVGSFRYSPLSFTYSFLFFGSIMALKDKNFLILPSLYLGQMIISYFQFESIYLLGPLFGFALTSLFTLLFPLILILLPLGYFNYFFSEYLIKIFLSLVHLSNSLATEGPKFFASTIIIICVFQMIRTRRPGWVLVLLFFQTQPLLNAPKSTYRKTPHNNDYVLKPASDMTHLKRTRRGYKSWHPYLIVCNNVLYQYHYERKCRIENKDPPKRWAL